MTLETFFSGSQTSQTCSKFKHYIENQFSITSEPESSSLSLLIKVVDSPKALIDIKNWGHRHELKNIIPPLHNLNK
jgi:hypothetical protein